MIQLHYVSTHQVCELSSGTVDEGTKSASMLDETDRVESHGIHLECWQRLAPTAKHITLVCNIEMK